MVPDEYDWVAELRGRQGALLQRMAETIAEADRDPGRQGREINTIPQDQGLDPTEALMSGGVRVPEL